MVRKIDNEISYLQKLIIVDNEIRKILRIKKIFLVY